MFTWKIISFHCQLFQWLNSLCVWLVPPPWYLHLTLELCLLPSLEQRQTSNLQTEIYYVLCWTTSVAEHCESGSRQKSRANFQPFLLKKASIFPHGKLELKRPNFPTFLANQALAFFTPFSNLKLRQRNGKSPKIEAFITKYRIPPPSEARFWYFLTGKYQTSYVVLAK